MKVALVTNMPAPYRVPCFNIIHQFLGDDFKVFFCASLEPNRKWNIPLMEFRHVFLKEKIHVKKDGVTFVHNNPDIIRHLKAYDPDIIITGGFNPTMLYAFLYTLWNRKKHIPLSDAWALSERHLSVGHKAIRGFVYHFSNAYLACSLKGKEYYESYGLSGDRIFISPYTINNNLYSNNKAFAERKYDLLFAGQFTERKKPLFFTKVASLVYQKKKDLKLLLLGDGPQRDIILEELRTQGISFDYGGYAKQEELPGYYSDSKLFLFPTENDAWGVVANEAAAAGTPVIGTPYAGCSGELIIDGRNGYILPLEEASWAEKCLSLLNDAEKWTTFSSEARITANQFTHEKSADELLKACRLVCKESKI
jgi:glycosyltransferase involved in cell wall biosynthesis